MVSTLANPGYITGWCSSGGHQDKDVLSKSGALLKRCQGDYEFPRLEKPNVQCTCTCHDVWRRLRDLQKAYSSSEPIGPTPASFEAVRLPLEPLKIHVTTPVLPFPMFGMVPPVTQSIYDVLFDDPHLTEHLSKLLVKFCKVAPHSVARDIRSFQRPRGSLDVNVEAVCRMFEDKIIPLINTVSPDIISLMADPDYPISPGAIRDVLLRFHAEGFIDISPSPVYFLNFKGLAAVEPISKIRERMKRAGDRLDARNR